MRAMTIVCMLAIVPPGSGAALAQQRPNPNALLNQWLEINQQNNVDTALQSAKEHAAAGRRDAAIADYRKVLSLEPEHPAAIAGLKALGLGDASIASPPLKLMTPNGNARTGGASPSPAPAGGGGGRGGGGILGGGLY